MRKSFTIPALFVLLVSACASVPSQGRVSTPVEMTAMLSTVIPDGSGTLVPSTPGPPASIPTLPGGLSLTELKYRVLEAFPDLFFCDPDYYPVAREDELALARQRFPDLQADGEEFQAILNHNGLEGLTTFTDEHKLLVYREHKRLNAIRFEPAGDRYRFQIQTGAEGQAGSLITATIGGDGSIDVLQREPGFPTCPICLAAGTWIGTPRGPVRVEDLRVGDTVWTQDEAGRRVAVPVLKTGGVRVPATHQMLHILLSDGRALRASPGHPTADGRQLGALQVGDVLDGAQILRMEQIPYRSGLTYDILPSGGTGVYWADDVLIGSTLSDP